MVALRRIDLLASIYSLPRYFPWYPISHHCDSIINITTSTSHISAMLSHILRTSNIFASAFPLLTHSLPARAVHHTFYPYSYTLLPHFHIPVPHTPSLSSTRGVVLFATIDSRKEEELHTRKRVLIGFIYPSSRTWPYDEDWAARFGSYYLCFSSVVWLASMRMCSWILGLCLFHSSIHHF